MELVTIRLTEDEYEKLEDYSKKAARLRLIRSASAYAACQHIVREVLRIYEDQASRDSS
jgi:hypothetical protein